PRPGCTSLGGPWPSIPVGDRRCRVSHAVAVVDSSAVAASNADTELALHELRPERVVIVLGIDGQSTWPSGERAVSDAEGKRLLVADPHAHLIVGEHPRLDPDLSGIENTDRSVVDVDHIEVALGVGRVGPLNDTGVHVRLEAG